MRDKRRVLIISGSGGGGGGSAAWGAITGTLSDQTDLQTALDAKQPLDADLTSWAAIARAAGFDTFVATPSSANLRTLLSDETGTGVLYFSGGNAGTPSAIVLTNATGLPTAGLVDDAVTYAKMQNISATSRVLGRITAGAGDPEELTAANVKTILALTFGDLASGTLAGNLAFGENTELILDPALSADGKYCGITEVVTAGETVAFGETVYLKAADSRYWLTDADADSTCGAVLVAIAATAGTAGNPMTVLRIGKIRADARFPALTIGAPVYFSTTPGAIQVAQPSGTDDVIRIAGYAITADEIFFNPSNDYMTHI